MKRVIRRIMAKNVRKGNIVLLNGKFHKVQHVQDMQCEQLMFVHAGRDFRKTVNGIREYRYEVEFVNKTDFLKIQRQK